MSRLVHIKAKPMNEPYKTNTRHILDHLILTDLILHHQTLKAQHRNEDTHKPDTLQGLFITREKVQNLIENKPVESTWFTHASPADKEGPDYASIVRAIKIHEKRISEKIKAGPVPNSGLKLLQLAHLFSLSDTEMKIFTICLAPYFSSKYEKLFAYLQDDPNKRLPTIDFILTIFHDTFEEKISCNDYFSPHSPLIKNRLIEFAEDGYEKKIPVTLKQLMVNNRIYNFMLNRQGMSEELESFTEYQYPARSSPDLFLPDNNRKKIDELINVLKDEPAVNNTNRLLYFHGVRGSGKKETAADLCHKLTIPLLVVDLRIPVLSGKNMEDIFFLINRECILLHTALYLENVDVVYNQAGNTILKELFEKAIQKNRNLIIISTETSQHLCGEFPGKEFFELDFPIPGYHKRKEIWKYYLKKGRIIKGNCFLDKKVDSSTLADKFRFTGLQIKNAVTAAYSNARWKTTEKTCTVTMQDLYAGCHSQSNKNLGPLAKKGITSFFLKDIILPPDEKKQLTEIINYVKYRHIVYDEWGFSQKFSQGRGLNVFFSGPPGVGKTMAAEIIAHELGLDLYKIDLSMVVSKYIGETEKNLNTIFNESSNAVLFFDEADALFGKRTEVKDAHDRYANIETGYLLQKIEEYEEGCVILATNMRENVDEAFIRRMHFTVTFPFPDKEYRLKIWQHIFPGKVSLGKDIDFEFLSENFKISGGSIKNIALGAAFFAAADGQVIMMKHIILATKREYQKINKLCTKDIFGDYYELIETS